MNWKDVAGVVGAAAPMLGTLIGGPAGAAVGAIIASTLGVSSPDEVAEALKVNPEAAAKLKELETTRQVELQNLLVQAENNRLMAETAQQASVNNTMQAETKADHWPSYTWRPFLGFCVGIMALGVYFVLPLLHISIPSIPESVWVMFGAILGVASWYRGKAQAAPNVPSDMRG